MIEQTEEIYAPARIVRLEFDPKAYGRKWSDFVMQFKDNELNYLLDAGVDYTTGNILFRCHQTGDCFAVDMSLVAAYITKKVIGQMSLEDMQDAD